MSQLTDLQIASDIWPTYEPAGETLNLYIYRNGSLAYQGAQSQHYGGSNQRFNFGFNFGVAQGDTITIQVVFTGPSGKISDIFPATQPSNSYTYNFSGTVFAGELDGTS